VAEIRLSPAAEADLEEIDGFGGNAFGKEVADQYSRGFREVFDVLRRHPEIGARRRELGRGVRTIAHRSHRIFYEVEGEVVLILRIFHHARDVKRSLLK
jgi:toxin ParE1/3/4